MFLFVITFSSHHLWWWSMMKKKNTGWLKACQGIFNFFGLSKSRFVMVRNEIFLRYFILFSGIFYLFCFFRIFLGLNGYDKLVILSDNTRRTHRKTIKENRKFVLPKEKDINEAILRKIGMIIYVAVKKLIETRWDGKSHFLRTFLFLTPRSPFLNMTFAKPIFSFHCSAFHFSLNSQGSLLA